MKDTEEIEAMRHIIVTYGKLQSLLHDVDRMVEIGVKRELKSRLNNFNIWLENFMEDKTALFDTEGHNKFIEYTTQLDQIGIRFGQSIPAEEITIDDK